MILDQVQLPVARLTAEVHLSKDLPFLRVHSLSNPSRDLLLPLRDEPLCGALARFTPLGRLHALYWTLTYGRIPEETAMLEPQLTLTFSNRFRFGGETATDPVALADRWWIGDVEGLYERAELQIDGVYAGQLQIPGATRC